MQGKSANIPRYWWGPRHADPYGIVAVSVGLGKYIVEAVIHSSLGRVDPWRRWRGRQLHRSPLGPLQPRSRLPCPPPEDCGYFTMNLSLGCGASWHSRWDERGAASARTAPVLSHTPPKHKQTRERPEQSYKQRENRNIGDASITPTGSVFFFFFQSKSRWTIGRQVFINERMSEQ